MYSYDISSTYCIHMVLMKWRTKNKYTSYVFEIYITEALFHCVNVAIVNENCRFNKSLMFLETDFLDVGLVLFSATSLVKLKLLHTYTASRFETCALFTVMFHV